jgi:hypothetical protein
MRFGSGNAALDIHHLDEMHFIYAFFFENGDDIYVKVGESVKPYMRLEAIVSGSPFRVSQAVFCHAGGKSVARKFEALVKKALSSFRTRGEWYAFKKEDSATFRAGMAASFAKATGRTLKWTRIDMAEFRAKSCRNGLRYIPR